MIHVQEEINVQEQYLTEVTQFLAMMDYVSVVYLLGGPYDEPWDTLEAGYTLRHEVVPS